jgi:two-component system nitrate/nitrite response regulator NarL
VDRHPPIRLLLADAHALTRSALGCLLRGRPELALVGEASTLPQCLGLASEAGPDVILLHPRPEGGLGVDAIPALLLTTRAEARLLLLTDAADSDVHRRAVRLGAYGIVGTDRPVETLLKAIEKVHQGEVWMERRLIGDLVGRAGARPESEQARMESLTPREREVVGLLCQGLRNKQIAGRLAVTDVTIRHHLTSVFSKLGVSNRLGLLLYASKHGLAVPHTFVPRHLAGLADASRRGD